MKLVLLGAPGAGKGTQAEFISKHFGIPAISTGNIIREAIKNGTEIGVACESLINEGKLISDETVITLVKERIKSDDCLQGYILDGCPRTVNQAIALDEMGVVINKIIDIEVKDEDILKRLSGRRVCPKCGNSYHTEYKKPLNNGICDACGTELVVRDDDKYETILKRLEVYHQVTEPLKEYYKKQGKLTIVVGQEQVADTCALTLKVLEA